MMEDTHIADGTAVKLLLAGIVLAGGVVGALGFAHGTSQAAADGPADEHSAQLAFPIDNFTAGGGSYQLSMDGKGNDPLTMAFPIDNFTTAFPIDNFTAASPIDDVGVSGGSWDVKGTDQTGTTGIESGDGKTTWALALMDVQDELPQDMDPY